MTSSLSNVQANFALNLLQKTGLTQSVVISPTSISAALGMVLIGAKNNTAKEIQSAIAEGLQDNELHQHLSQLFSKNKYEFLKIANKIYISKDLEVLAAYKKDIMKYYFGCFQQIDFTKINEVVNEINQFVAESTDNEITNVIDSEMIKESSKIILINAIKFQKQWATEFTIRQLESIFYTAPDFNTKTIMMSKHCQYTNHDTYQLLKILYDDHSFNMFIILPRERYGLSMILKDLDGTKLLNLMSLKEYQLGNVVIPKFEIESTFNLNEVLQELNINDAFNEKAADFSGMTKEKTFISKIIHKTRIKVSEKETLASAVTLVQKDYYSYESTQPIFDFNADHPFLYLIADTENNIFFIGTFYNS